MVLFYSILLTKSVTLLLGRSQLICSDPRLANVCNLKLCRNLLVPLFKIILTLVNLFLFFLHLEGFFLEFRLFGCKHILLLSELRFKLFDFLFLFLDNLLSLLTVLIQIHFLKGNSLEIVVLV